MVNGLVVSKSTPAYIIPYHMAAYHIKPLSSQQIIPCRTIRNVSAGGGGLNRTTLYHLVHSSHIKMYLVFKNEILPGHTAHHGATFLASSAGTYRSIPLLLLTDQIRPNHLMLLCVPFHTTPPPRRLHYSPRSAVTSLSSSTLRWKIPRSSRNPSTSWPTRRPAASSRTCCFPF